MSTEIFLGSETVRLDRSGEYEYLKIRIPDSVINKMDIQADIQIGFFEIGGGDVIIRRAVNPNQEALET